MKQNRCSNLNSVTSHDNKKWKRSLLKRIVNLKTGYYFLGDVRNNGFQINQSMIVIVYLNKLKHTTINTRTCPTNHGIKNKFSVLHKMEV